MKEWLSSVKGDMTIRCLWFLPLNLLFTVALFTDEIRPGFENGVGIDGAGRFKAYGIIGIGQWDFGASGLWLPGRESRAMIGTNSPHLSAGHLSDSGLAAEMRNANYKFLSRLRENTAFRADIRSHSQTRYGLALFTADRRYAVAWERRKAADAGIIFIVPVQIEIWTLEILGESGLIRPKAMEKSWYPKNPGNPGGPFASLAMRNRFFISSHDFGLTLIASGGSNFRPGFLAAAAWEMNQDALRIRFRTSWADQAYRSADGELQDTLSGISWDFRYNADPGLVCSAGFRFALLYHPHAFHYSREPGFLLLGWNFDTLKISGRFEWDGITTLPQYKNMKFNIDLDLSPLSLEYRFSLSAIDSWYMSLGSEYNFKSFLNLGLNAELQRKREILFSLGMSLSASINSMKVSMELKLRDLPRDWRHGPNSAGDFEAVIKVIYRP